MNGCETCGANKGERCICKQVSPSNSSACSGADARTADKASVGDEVVQGLRQMLADRETAALEAAVSPRSGDGLLPPEDSYCGECGAKLSFSLQSLWLERYAELLGCESRLGAVAVAIGELHDEMDRCRKSISRHRKAAFEQGVLHGRASKDNTAKPTMGDGPSVA